MDPYLRHGIESETYRYECYFDASLKATFVQETQLC